MAPSNGHVKGPSLKDAIRVAVDKGRVNLNGKQIELPDQVVDWLAMLLGGVRG
jgi:hypothetical protein